MSFLSGWLGGAKEADKSAEALPMAGEDAAPESAADRRNREPATAGDQILETVAQKVLHGWLQNRNQTQMPLSINLARLAPRERAGVVRFAALVATCGGDEGSPDRMRSWLASADADEAALAVFAEAIEAPPRLGCSLTELAAPHLAPLAFVTALVGARDGRQSSRLFAEFVAARLSLSSAAIRSAERRYRA